MSVAEYRTRFEANPGDVEAFRQLRDAYSQAEEWPALADVFQQRAAAVASGLEAIHLHLIAAEVYETRADAPQSALHNYEAALALDERNPKALQALTRIYRDQNRWDDYLQIAQRSLGLLSDKSERAAFFGELARVFETEQRDLTRATLYYKKAYQCDPANPHYLGEGRRAFGNLGRWDMVIRLLEVELKLTQPADRQRELLWLRAHIYASVISDKEKAKAAYRELLDRWEATPEMNDHAAPHGDWSMLGLERPPSPLEPLVSAYEESEDWTRLVGVLRRMVKLTANLDRKGELYQRIGSLEFHRLGDAESARKNVERALTIAPFNRDALATLEQIVRQQQDWITLDQILLKRVLQSDGDETLTLYHELLVIYRDHLDQPQQALDVLKRMMEISPEHELVKASIASYAGLPDELRDLLSTLRSRLIDAELWEEVLRANDRLLELTTGERQIPLLREAAEIAESRLNDTDRAFSYYIQLSDRFPAAESVYDKLETLAALLGKPEQVMEIYRKQLTLANADDPQRVLLAKRIAKLATAQEENPKAAFQAFRQLVEIAPGDPELRQRLIDVARAAKDETLWRQVTELWDRAIAVASSGAEKAALQQEKATILRDELNAGEAAFELLVSASLLDVENLAWVAEAEALAVTLGRTQPYLDYRRQRWGSLDLDGDKIRDAHGIARFVETHELDWEAAFEFYLLAFQLDPFDGTSEQKVLEICDKQQDWELYIKVIELQLREYEGIDEQGLLILKLALLGEERTNDLSFARRQFERALRLNTRNTAAVDGLRRIAEKTGNWARYLEFVEVLSTQTSDTEMAVKYLVDLGEIARTKLDDATRAGLFYSRILEHEPYHEHAVAALKRLYEERGDRENLAALLLGQLGRPEGGGHADQLRAAAELKQQLGQLSECEAIYRQLIALEPDNAKALDWLQSYYLKQRRYHDLREILEMQLSFLAGEETLPRIWELCVLYELGLLAPERSWLQLKHLLERFPQHPQVLAACAAFHERYDHWEDALALYRDHRAAFESANPEGNLDRHIAELYYRKLNDHKRAQIYFENALERDKQDHSLLAPLADCYAQLQQWAKALSTLEKLIDMTPRSASQVALLELKGSILETRLFRFDQAKRCYETIIKLDPFHPVALLRLLTLAEKAGDWKSWVLLVEQALESGVPLTTQCDLLWRASETYRGRLDDQLNAQRLLRKLVALDPEHETAQELLLGMETIDENWQEALALHLKQAEPATGSNRAHHLFKAAKIAEHQLGDPTQALALYRQANDADPAFFPALLPLATLAYNANEWPTAERFLYEFFRGMKVPANSASADQLGPEMISAAFMQLGRITLENGVVERALTAFQSALEYESGSAEIYRAVADCHYRLGQFDSAQQNYEIVLDQCDGDAAAEVRLRLADSYQRQHKLAEAIAQLDQITDDPEAQTDVLSRLIDLCEETEQRGRAARYLEQLLLRVTSADDRFAALVKLSQFCRDEGDFVRAFHSLEQALEIHDDVSLRLEYLELAKTLRRTDVLSSALNALEKHDPPPQTMARALCLVASSYLSQEQRDKALIYYRKSEALDPALADTFSGIEQIYEAAGDHDALVEHYRRFLGVIDTRPELTSHRKSVHKKLIQTRVRSLGVGAPSLREDYRALLELDDEDGELLRNYIEYVHELGDRREECDLLATYISRFPADRFGYDRLWSIANDSGDVDFAFRVATLLFFIKEANADQERLYLTHHRKETRLGATVPSGTYEGMIQCRTKYSWIYRVFLLVNAEAHDLFSVRPEERKLAYLRRVDDNANERTGQVFTQSRRLFQSGPASLFLGPGQNATPLMGNATPPYIILNEDFVLSLLETQQIFLFARLLELTRAEHILAMSFPGIELTALIQAFQALALPKQSEALSESRLSRGWRDVLETRLSKGTISFLRKNIRNEGGDAPINASLLARTVHHDITATANRVGLVAMNDIILGLKLLLRLEGEDIAYVESAAAFGRLVDRYEPLKDLLRYYLSSQYGELRRALKLAVER